MLRSIMRVVGKHWSWGMRTMRMRDGAGCTWREITVELCIPSSLGKMAPDGDLPPCPPPYRSPPHFPSPCPLNTPLRFSLSLALSLPPPPPFQLRVINPLLFMKIYNIAIQLYDSTRSPIGRSSSRGGEPWTWTFLYIISNSCIEQPSI